MDLHRFDSLNLNTQSKENLAIKNINDTQTKEKDDLCLLNTQDFSKLTLGPRIRPISALDVAKFTKRGSVNSIKDSDEPIGYAKSRTHNDRRDQRSHNHTIMDVSNQDKKYTMNLRSSRKRAEFHEGSYKTYNKVEQRCHTKYFTSHYICNLIEKNDQFLIRELLKNKVEFGNIFCGDRKVNDMGVIFLLLNRIGNLSDETAKEYFLSYSLNQEFNENVTNYLNYILLQFSSVDLDKHLLEIEKFYFNIVQIIPTEKLNEYNEILMSILSKLNKVRNISESIINKVTELINKIDERLCDSSQLVIDSLCIIPSLQDLSVEPKLQKNIIKGSYESPSHYLKLHFELLKEDFVSSLRSGYQEYNVSINDKKSIRFKEIFVYEAIYCGIVPGKSNIALKFEISTKMLKRLEWTTTNRLKHGSLLLISDDNFKMFFYALLENRETPKIDSKHFTISACVFDKFTNVKQYSRCIIIEPKVFFTPYFHVLKSLKKIDPNLFPMEKYITRVDSESDPPNYLKKGVVYKIGEQEVALNSDSSWENAEKLDLNKSQAKALQAALTKEFVIIQGPPGTGKSYLGIKIIKTLLDNKQVWEKGNSPILVICYRNNAIDQILESLIKCDKKIVRLGSQSSSNEVKNYCLRTAIQSIKTHPVIRDQIDKLKAEINTLKHNILLINRLITIIDKEKAILSVNSLKTVITDKHYHFFSFSNVYVDWLFGGDHKNDSLHKSNEHKFTEIISDNGNLNYAELKSIPNSFFLINVYELVTEITDIQLEINYLYDDGNLPSNQALSATIQLLQLYEEKEVFLKKFINRMNLDADNFIDPSSLNNTNDLTELSISDRWKLYKFWACEFSKQTKKELEEMFQLFNKKIDALEDLMVVSDGHKLRQLNPDVVGATTTGAARLQSLLAVIKPQIVVFEEAAEVLEAHTVAALSPFCEHIIFIGDHQQLRPNPASYNSVAKYNLDISLFERMIINGMKCLTLNEQHRMRPLISSLVIPQFYPSLKNHKSVEDYPNVKGLKDNMFFIDHTFPEDQMDDSDSHRNKNEANFVLAFADYIIKQGYEKKDVTILTVYSAQLFYLKECSSRYRSLKGVGIEVVDNFQGEENKIILLSLVRSNPHTIGFLSKQNRICVGLTRAKEGFYLIGNMTSLKGKSKVWEGINETLQKNCVIGTDLPLKCSTHGTLTMVSSSTDFVPLVFGGCRLKCGVKLNCGHTCDSQCHGDDESHSLTFSCNKPCERKKKCAIHDCEKLCGEPCPRCTVHIKTGLPCGHDGHKMCEGDLLSCKSKCTKPLICGHPCSKRCHFPNEHLIDENCSYPCGKPNKSCPVEHRCEKPCGANCGECTVITLVNLPCGHVARGECNVVHQTNCKVLVEKYLDCGHVAKVQCDKLTSEEISKEHFCNKKVEKELPCGHTLKVPCYLHKSDYIFCDALVKKLLKCGHDCVGECSTPSDKILCSEKVPKSAKCGHTLEVACHEGPESVLCNHPCDLTKSCGHKCRGRCGEPCPECPELIENLQVCGHLGKLPCSKLTENALLKEHSTEANPHVSLKCQTACKVMMECEHQCEGNCDKCMQGRVHKVCEAPCGQSLLCGHKCSTNCSFGIHLCNKICLNSCKHQTCKHKCCDSCSKCKEKCEWKCEHLACTRLCWEECDRPPCDMPCRQLLPCSHTCNGLCGEPCPPICFICSPNKNEGTKYILLEDCGHFISMNELNSLITSTIGLFLCPICQKPQIKTNYIRHHSKYWFAQLLRIKDKMLFNYNQTRDLTYDLKNSLQRTKELLKTQTDDFLKLKLLLNDIVLGVKDTMFKKSRLQSIDSLRSLVFVSHYVFEAFNILDENNLTGDKLFLSKIDQIALYFLEFKNADISRAQMYQFKNELLRIHVLCKLVKLKNITINENDIYKKAWKLANTMKVLDEKVIREIKVCVEQIPSNMEINLSLAESKFLFILEKFYQVTLHRQHWKKCEHNHLYYAVNSFLSQINCPTCSNSKCLYFN